MEIRYEACQQIHFKELHKFLLEIFNYNYSENELRNRMMNNGVVVLNNENEIVGFTCIGEKISNNIIMSGTTAIHPDYRGLGIGTKLIKQKLESLKNVTVILSSWIHPVPEGETTSNIIYEKLGFVEIEHIDGYYGISGDCNEDDKEPERCPFRTEKCVCSKKLLIKHID